MRIRKRINDSFRQFISRQWGTYDKGLLSIEVERAIIKYMEGERPNTKTAHTHKNSQLPPGNKGDTPIPLTTKNFELETTTAIVAGGGKEYHNRPPQDDPILKQWLLTKGIEVTNMDSIASHITQEDITVGELSELELDHWKKNIYERLIAKRRRIDNKKWRSTVSEKDRMLEPELRTIKQHLNNTDSIIENNKVHVDQIYKAWASATHKRDKQRVFKNRLDEYIDGGYFTPLDDKHRKLRVENKFLAL